MIDNDKRSKFYFFFSILSVIEDHLNKKNNHKILMRIFYMLWLVHAHTAANANRMLSYEAVVMKSEK